MSSVKPIALFRHAHSEGPGYFATWLERHSIPVQTIAIDAGDPLPRTTREYSGLVFMGGPMSVNDALPWIAPALELIRSAVRSDLPVLGHCLGGQLLSKALGGTVGPAPVKEIGWGAVRVSDNSLAHDWLGEGPGFEVFQWHGESFSLPLGATRILENVHCTNQAFVIGRHLGLQCHIEMTEELVRRWCDLGQAEIAAAAASPGVQQVPEIERELERRIAALNRSADRLYDRWALGLSRGSS